MSSDKVISRILWANQEILRFWINHAGWGPPEVKELLEKSRLDWQLSLTFSLERWVKLPELSDGDLILAWVNLGALVEGILKLFLCIFYLDYCRDPRYTTRKNKEKVMLDPDEFDLEKLKIFFHEKGLISKEDIAFIGRVQFFRNSIHAFKSRNIGTRQEFLAELKNYLLLISAINGKIPYPDEVGSLLILNDIE